MRFLAPNCNGKESTYTFSQYNYENHALVAKLLTVFGCFERKDNPDDDRTLNFVN